MQEIENTGISNCSILAQNHVLEDVTMFKRFLTSCQGTYLLSKSQRGGPSPQWVGYRMLVGFCWLLPQFSGLVNQVFFWTVLSIFLTWEQESQAYHSPFFFSFLSFLFFAHLVYFPFSTLVGCHLNALSKDSYTFYTQ